MKAWVQRVTEASVEIAGERVAEIGQGYLVLLGVTHTDTEKAADEMAERICTLRIFEDEAGKTNRSLVDVGGSVIVVSQFTLYADCRKGRRPGFDLAGDPAAANELYEYFAERLKAEGVARVATGRFGADMLVSLENDGPATFLLSHPWEFSTTTNPEAEE